MYTIHDELNDKIYRIRNRADLKELLLVLDQQDIEEAAKTLQSLRNDYMSELKDARKNYLSILNEIKHRYSAKIDEAENTLNELMANS